MGRRKGLKSTKVYWVYIHPSFRLTGLETGFLTPEESDRLAGFRFSKRREDWLLGRWAAKKLLLFSSEFRDAKGLDSFIIRNAESGQPYAVDAKGNQVPGCLSISHRDGTAICAYTPASGVGLGVDLEVIETRLPSFIDDYLTVNEQRVASGFSGMQKDILVTLAWSAKEAALKAFGSGLRMDPRKIEISGYEGEHIPCNGVSSGCWNLMNINGDLLSARFQGRWMRLGNFVLALALLSTGETNFELIYVNG